MFILFCQVKKCEYVSSGELDMTRILSFIDWASAIYKCKAKSGILDLIYLIPKPSWSQIMSKYGHQCNMKNTKNTKY